MRLFWFERVRTFTIVSADNDCFLHANIARYYFLVTNANSTLVFHKRVNWIRADESSPLVPTRCLLSFVSNGSLILLFFSYGSKCNYSSQVISYCSRILNKKETFISGRYLRLSSSSLCMGYWPSVRSRWLDIGQVLFLRVYGPRRSRGP